MSALGSSNERIHNIICLGAGAEYSLGQSRGTVYQICDHILTKCVDGRQGYGINASESAKCVCLPLSLAILLRVGWYSRKQMYSTIIEQISLVVMVKGRHEVPENIH